MKPIKDPKNQSKEDASTEERSIRPHVAKRNLDSAHLGGIGGYLRGLRQRDRRTTRAVAKATGLSVGYVGMIETGQRHPNMEALKKLAALYQIEEIVLLRMAGYLNPWDEILPYSAIHTYFHVAMNDLSIADSPHAQMIRLHADHIAASFILELYTRITDRRFLTHEERQRVCAWLPMPDWGQVQPSEEDLNRRWSAIEQRHYEEDEPFLWDGARQVVQRFRKELIPVLASNRWKPTPWDFTMVRPSAYPTPVPADAPESGSVPDESFIYTPPDASFEEE